MFLKKMSVVYQVISAIINILKLFKTVSAVINLERLERLEHRKHIYSATYSKEPLKILLCVAKANFSCPVMTLGVMFSWPSSTYAIFASNSTTLERPMTVVELSLLGSLSSISILLVIPFTGFLVDKLGRKRSFIGATFVQVIAWIVVVSSNNVIGVLASMFINGLSGCIVIVVPVYVGEICQESIRGAMTSLCMTFFSLGILLSYILGGFLEYHVMNYVSLTLTALGVLMLVFVKESPVYLMKIGAEKEAARCLAYYRGVKENSKEVLTEMENIMRIINPVLDGDEKLKPEYQPDKKLSTWAFFKKSRSSRLALILTLVLFTAEVFQGLLVVQVYAMPLFKEAMPSISNVLSSIIFAIVTIIGGLIGAYLVEKLGRRFLMIYASLASGLLCILLGTQIQLHWGPSWLTAVMMLLYSIGYSLGAGMIPLVMVAEVFLPEIKGFATMLAMEWAYLCNFVILFIFNPIVASIGLGPVFYIFAGACLLSAIFCVFCLPETKGLTVEAIQTLFYKKTGQQDAS